MLFRKAEPGALPTDEYLDDAQLLELQHMLVESALNLLLASKNTVTALTDVREHDADVLDQAVNESDREFNLRLAGRERVMLEKIKHALDCMDEGEYGCCQGCGEFIGSRRLLVRPVARYCIDCKTQAEQLERRSRAF